MRFIGLLVAVSWVLAGVPAYADFYLDDGMMNVSSRGVKWALQLPARDFTMKIDKHAQDRTGHYYYFDTADPGFTFSFYLEPVTKCKTARECRDNYLQYAPPLGDARDIKNFDLNGFSVVEFLVPEIRGIKANQMNFSAHHVRDGYWVYLHLSKLEYRPEDRKKLVDFIKSASFKADKAAPFAAGDEIAPRALPVPGQGALVVDIPRSWTRMITTRKENEPQVLILRPRAGDDFELHLTPVWRPYGESGPVSRQRVRDFVVDLGHKVVKQAKEGELIVQRVKRPEGSAFYYFATDKEKEGYPYAIQGAFGTEDLLVAVTFLFRQKDAPEADIVQNLFETGRKRN